MRGVAFVGIVAAFVGLSGCVRDPYVSSIGETKTGEWYVAHQIDRVTGAELPSATVFADASNTGEYFANPSSLAISCFDQKPIVRFAFPFKLGTTRNAVLGYRFDDKSGHEDVPARIVSPGHQIIVIEDKNAVAQFVSELRGSRKLYMRMRSLTAGRSSAEYPLDGSEAAIRAAFANCPMPPPPAPKRTS